MPWRRKTFSPVEILLDRGLDYGDRDDAALELASHDEPEAEDALSRTLVANDTYEGLADTCAQSLAEIWSRQGRVELGFIRQLDGDALVVLLATMAKLQPSLARSIPEPIWEKAQAVQGAPDMMHIRRKIQEG